MVKFFAAFGSLLTAAIWGFAFVIVKDSLNSVSALYICAIRFTIATIILALFLWNRLKKINLEYLKKAGLVGVFLFLAYAIQTIGCNYTSPGKNAFFTTVYVVLVPLYGWLIYKKRPAWFVFLSVFLQVLGIGFLSLGDDISKGFSFNIGDILTIICSIFYCLQIFYQAHFTKNSEESDPFLYALIQFAVCALLSWIFSPFYDAERNLFTFHLQKFPVEAFKNVKFILSICYLGFLSTGLAFVLQNIGLKYLKSSLATILLSFESVFGMLFSVLIPVNGVREKLSFAGVIGCVLIFTAVILAQMEEKKRDKLTNE